jgi:hypothetical protein
MKRLKSLFIALLLSSQLSFAGAFESFNVAVNEVHQVFSHNQAIEHHHHDAFEMVKVLIAPPPQAPPSVFLDGFLRPPRATV